MAKPQSATPRKCTKCNERDAAGKHQWCLPCQAEYRKSYGVARETLARGRGFGEGVEAMRRMLVVELKSFGFTRVTMWEAAAMIERAPRPRLDLLIAAGTLPKD